MKLKTDPLSYDLCLLTWWDIVRLIFKMPVTAPYCALIVRRGEQ